MQKSAFNYFLPPELIAKYPLPERSDSRLLVFERLLNKITHSKFKSLINFLRKDDLLVFNDSKVLKARFFGTKDTGGKVEFLVEKIEDDFEFVAHIKASKAPKNGSCIHVDNWQITVLEKNAGLYKCKASIPINLILDSVGHMPLPSYLHREDDKADINRYQTVYAKDSGSVAAPTAGLHFDEAIFKQLKDNGINVAYVTLHVGAGTFQPVRVENVADHVMHTERYIISAELVQAVLATKAKGGRVIAVGTTSMRSLESAAADNFLEVGYKETNIFITPGYKFKICDGLITNFHLPESTLIMLVAAFIGYRQTMDLYAEAISQKYRFYSYGDVSLLL